MKAEELLNYIDEEKIILIMQDLGSPLMRISYESGNGQKLLWFKTICHGGNSNKLCWFTENKNFYCYTNCGHMSLFELVKKVKCYSDSEFGKCMVYLLNILKINDNNKNNIGKKESEEVKKTKNFDSKINNKFEYRKYNDENLMRSKINSGSFLKEYDSKILNYFDHNTFYNGWINEGISIQSMQKYNICWYEYEKHIIIPHYDENGKLVGIRRRSLKPEDSKNKYMPEFIEGKSYEHSLGQNLYGLYQNKEAIKKAKNVVIVEGEKSVLLSDTFFENKSTTVATCGFNISDWQIYTLKKYGVKKIYLGFDKDFDINKECVYSSDPEIWREYQNYLNKINNIILKLNKSGFIVCWIVDKNNLLKIKDSPFDEGLDTFLELKKNAKIVSIRN